MSDKELKKGNTSDLNVNKYEHHIDIKSTPLTPFKAKGFVSCVNSSCNWHDNLEILYITEGYGTIRYGITNIDLVPETVIIINSQTMHSITSENGVSFFMYIIDNRFFAENGIDPFFYTARRRDYEEVLPWEHMDYGVTKKFLISESKKAHEGVTTACCREKCAGRGANKLNGGACDEIGKTVV